MASAVANSRTRHHQKQKLSGVPASPLHPGRSGDGHGQVLGGGHGSVRSSRSSTPAAATGTVTPTPPVAASSRRSVTPTSRDRDRQDQGLVSCLWWSFVAAIVRALLREDLVEFDRFVEAVARCSEVLCTTDILTSVSKLNTVKCIEQC